MKLVLTLCLLALAVPGWAGELRTSELYPGELLLTQKQLNLLQESVEQNYEGKLRVMLIDHPCLAQMEAAMRAMDHWIPWNPAQVEAIASAIKGDDPWAVKALGSNEDRRAAIDRWVSATRDCWKATP